MVRGSGPAGTVTTVEAGGEAEDTASGCTRAIVEDLLACLREEAGMPAPPERVPDPAETGWYVPPPQDAHYGRTPWVHLRDLDAWAVGHAVVLSFRFTRDPARAHLTYLLVAEAPQGDVVIGSEHLHMRLDWFLDWVGWQDTAQQVGPRTVVALLPPYRAGRL